MKMSEVRRISVGTGPAESGDGEDSVLTGESLREKMRYQDQELIHLRTEMKKLQKCLRLIVSQGKILHAAKSSKPPTCKSDVTKATGMVQENRDRCGIMTKIESGATQIESEENQTEYEAEQRLHQTEERLRMDVKRIKNENSTKEHKLDVTDLDKYYDPIKDNAAARPDTRKPHLDQVLEDEYSFCGDKIQSKHFSNSSSIVILQEHCEEFPEGNPENSPNKDTDFEHVFVTVGVDTKDLDWENEKSILRKSNADLSRRLEKITEVNSSWDKFWSRKRTHFESVIAEKDSKIRKLQFKVNKLQDKGAENKKQLKVIIAEKEQILKDKDEILLLTKTRIEKLESTIEQLRKELAESNDKNERAQKFARTLLQQKTESDMEIKRLNKILEENVKEQQLIGLAAKHDATNKTDPILRQPLNDLSGVKSDTKRKTSILDENIKHSDGEKRREPRRKTDLRETTGRKEHVELVCEPEETTEESLTKDELKEQIMHLKEQTNAYESDFRQERRDREKAVAKLQDMKEKLDETRQVQRKYQKSHQTRQDRSHCCEDRCTHCKCIAEHSRHERTTNKKRTCLCLHGSTK